jgi:choline dehydrogenase
VSAVRQSYDYIVVGARAAGCVVANRLSADGSSVLVLEAGGRDINPLIHIPLGFTKLTTPDVNWGYSTVPQPQMNNRDMWYPQRRTLGGVDPEARPCWPRIAHREG